MTPAARRRNTWESREDGGASPAQSEAPPQVCPFPADETAATTRVELAWPDRLLHPNSRPHWSHRAKAARKAREAAGWAAKEAGLSNIAADAVHVSLTFHPRSRRAVDLDGCLSACKSALDGLADVIGVDDSRWSLSIRRAEPRPPHGAVIVEIAEAKS